MLRLAHGHGQQFWDVPLIDLFLQEFKVNQKGYTPVIKTNSPVACLWSRFQLSEGYGVMQGPWVVIVPEAKLK